MNIRRFRRTFILGLLISLAGMLSAAAATFTVTNVKDSGAGSLRDAVAQANANGEDDTIDFDPTFFDQARTITLTSGELEIQSDGTNPAHLLTIEGPGANLLTISGNNQSRIFFISALNSNAVDTISGLTLRDGNGTGTTNSLQDGNGGAIFVFLGSLTLRNTIVTVNTASSSGGAIFLAGSKGFLLENSSLTNNSAGGGGGALNATAFSSTTTYTVRNSIISDNTAGADRGGAAFNSGITTIIDSTFSGNQANDSAGGLFLSATTATITNSVFANNEANGEGAGLYLSGGTVVLRAVTVSGNSIGSTSLAGGGGIRISGGDVDLIDSTVTNNSLTNAPLGSEGNGGGLLSASSGTVNLINSTFFGNQTAMRGLGGGIYVTGPGPTNIINCTVVNNAAFEDNSGNNSGLNGGGGIFSNDITQNGLTNIQNTIVANNSGPVNPDVGGDFVSNGYNLIGATGASSGFGAIGDQLNVDPLLDPAGLQDNGGLTLTIALQANSPAIDKGKSADLLTDQRSLPRPYDHASIPNASGGDGSDIGAFEDQPPNTLPGDNVTVEAPLADAGVTFPSVSQGGFTTFTRIHVPSLVGIPPAGYTTIDDAPAYEITTTATFSPPATVCLTVASITDEAEFARVRVLHGEDGQLVDRTDHTSLDFANRTVCAQVDSFSPFVIALAPPPGLINISTRLQVLTDDQVLIGGFIITGTDPKMVILRAIGPSLEAFGIDNPLADPVLELRAADGSLITTNDNWKADQAAVEATGFQPSNDLESAIVATLDPGSYTAIMSGKNGGTGVGLVEAYDLNQEAASEFANISTRGFVETENNVMIGGFILGSDTNVLVRAIGPTLTALGVTDALADPTLELRDAQGMVISSNDNWKEGDQQLEIEATDLQPQMDAESALIEALPAGAYTAIVAGQGGLTGVALVEAYRLP